MDSLKNKYNSVREEGIRNKVSAVRGDGFRNKVLNRGDKGSNAGPAYTPRPISELKDPSFFPPPPRRRTTDPHNLTSPPPPPARTASSYSTASQPAAAPTPTPRAAPPSLPPRLPPRAPPITMEDRDTDDAPEPYINQSAASRLAASGISVPDLGISPHAQQPESQGTSWAQKKSALKTISDFNRDPSSVSLQDARAAATTGNNFRERHGAEVARGAKVAGELNQKYGVAERVGGYAGSSGAGASATSLASIAGKKRPPPPPPPKKASLSGGGPAGGTPPPLPMGSKPRF